jgi:pyruvate/2-oxoglutarate dehydrogenase complex dihydrolipoamide dehydrogenase (E3) component
MASTRNHFDLIVFGSGAASASCWSAAVQLGKRVAVFEPGLLGGECPNVACMPTKALLHCAEVYETAVGAERFGVRTGPVAVDYARVKAWKDEVVSHTGAALGDKPYADAGVALVRSRARFISPSEVEADGRVYTAERFLVATGAAQPRPDIPGLAETGYLISDQAIDLTALPASALILGGGAVGCEFAHLWSAFGARVTIADRNLRLLHKEDSEVGDFLAAHFRRRGVDVRLKAGIARVERTAAGKRVTLSPGGDTVVVEEILVATGKAPNTDLGLNVAGIEFNRDGIVVDETLRTTNARVYAAGDVVGPYRFTHAASYQGRVACDNMFGARRRRADYRAMPRCVFTSPEVAAVGETEQEARAKGTPIRVGRAGMDAADRALTGGRTEGFVKVIADASGRVLGGAVVGDRAGEVAQELALAVALSATAAQVAGAIHAFPTYSEALVAACQAVQEPGKNSLDPRPSHR